MKPVFTNTPGESASPEPAPAPSVEWKGLVRQSKLPPVRKIRIPTGPKLPVFAAVAQGCFCLVLGVWPAAGFAALLRVTGQKADRWSLTLAGLLLATIGLNMLITAIRRDVAFEVYVMGMMTAVSLAATDLIFVIARSIPAVYLLDAVAEMLFVTLWVFAIREKRRAGRLPIDPAPPTGAGNTTERGEIDATG